MNNINSLSELVTAIPDETSARAFMEKIIWGDTPTCPHCYNQGGYKLKNGKTYKCKDKRCHKTFTVTVGTVLENASKKIKEFNNLKEASMAVKAQSNCIRLVLLGKAFTCKGYHWKLGKGTARINIQLILEKKLEKLRKGVCRPATQFDLNGKQIKTYRSIAEAARAINVNPMNIHGALKTIKPYNCKGFAWRYSKT